MRKRSMAVLAVTVILWSGCTGKKDEEPKTPKSQEKVRIVVSGSNTTTPILEILAKEYAASHQEISFDFLPSSHTAGGVKGAQSGELDLGAISRYLHKDEQALGLTLCEFARDGLVFVTNQNIKLSNVTAKQLRDIYSGRIAQWHLLGIKGLKEDDMVVIDRPAHASAKEVLLDILFTGNFTFGPNVVTVERALDVNDALIKTPNSLGYTSLGIISMERLPLNLLQIDGVAPTMENIKSGKFPYFRPLGVVYRPDVKPAAVEFIEFLKTPQARQLITANGYLAML